MIESSGRQGLEDFPYMPVRCVLRCVLYMVPRVSDLIYGLERYLSALELRLGWAKSHHPG